MKSALHRALAIADEIESFKWMATDDAEGIYYSVNELRGLAIRLKAAARSLDHPCLREGLERLQINIDGNNFDFDAGVALHARFRGSRTGFATWSKNGETIHPAGPLSEATLLIVQPVRMKNTAYQGAKESS
jgi:hypothetical protein